MAGRADISRRAVCLHRRQDFTAAIAVEDDMRVLLVEDDKDLQRLLKDALSDAGYVVDMAADGEQGHFLGDTEPYDVAILDLGLPKMDGVRVLEKWRKSGRTMPVLVLTARDRWSDKVAGFDAGADDYLAKPFYTEELLARVRALLRRAAGLATSEIEIGPLRIDTRASRVTMDGNPVKLTSLEYRLLSYLAHHQGKVVSRTELVEHLYDQDFDRDSNTIEVFVGRLRKKLGSNLIQTVRGLGYSLENPDAAAQTDRAKA
jgi:two-component system OmpR family response regulator